MQIKKSSTRQRHEAVCEHFDLLHEKKRKRYDDCVTETANKFFLAEKTVLNILKERKRMINMQS